jgi:hypothetical protein
MGRTGTEPRLLLLLLDGMGRLLARAKERACAGLVTEDRRSRENSMSKAETTVMSQMGSNALLVQVLSSSSSGSFCDE